MRLMEKVLPFTPEGKEEFGLEIDLLEHFRQEILDEYRAAPKQAQDALRRELAAVEEHLSLLNEAIARGEVISDTGLTVAVGSEVTLETEYGRLTFMIVGPVAATPRRGCISYDSPMGQALLGAELGDRVELIWDGGRRKVRVVGIRRGRLTEEQAPVLDTTSRIPTAFQVAFD